MRPHSLLTDARPRISSMPRQKTEAAAYLNLYKLSVEKKRLQYELETIEQRREHVQARLVSLESQIAEMSQSAELLKNESAATQPIAQPVFAKSVKQGAPDTAAFKTVFLEY